MAGIPAEPVLKHRAAWISTFVAGLELAKQGEMTWCRRTSFTSARGQRSRPDGSCRASGSPKDKAERLRRGATGETEQCIAENGRRGKRHATIGFRIGPSDRAEIDGDIVHVRPRGADGLRDDAFAIDPASRGGGTRIGADGDLRLLLRPATARRPCWCGRAKQCSLITRRALHIVTLGASLATDKAGATWRGCARCQAAAT